MSRQKSPPQSSLFDANELPAPNSVESGEAEKPQNLLQALVVPEGVGQPKRNASQQAFYDLIQKIEKKRTELQGWRDALDEITQRAATRKPALTQEILQAQRALMIELHQAWDFARTAPRGKGVRVVKGAPKPLSLRAMATVRKYLIYMFDVYLELLEGDLDAELEAIYDQHHDVKWRQSNEEDERLQREIFQGQFGFQPEDFETPEALHAAIQQKLHELQSELADQAEAKRAEQDARKAAKRAKNPKTAKIDAAKAKAAQEIDLSLRDVFRKLAGALHPDREMDPERRAQKTALMQQVNQAYEARDLLALLNLQLQAEQLDTVSLWSMSREKLKLYNQLLKEQLKGLDQEIEQVRMRAVVCLDAAPFEFAAWSEPDDLIVDMDDQICDMEEALESIQTYLTEVRKPDGVKRMVPGMKRELDTRTNLDIVNGMFDDFDVPFYDDDLF